MNYELGNTCALISRRQPSDTVVTSNESKLSRGGSTSSRNGATHQQLRYPRIWIPCPPSSHHVKMKRTSGAEARVMRKALLPPWSRRSKGYSSLASKGSPCSSLL